MPYVYLKPTRRFQVQMSFDVSRFGLPKALASVAASRRNQLPRYPQWSRGKDHGFRTVTGLDIAQPERHEIERLFPTNAHPTRIGIAFRSRAHNGNCRRSGE